MKRKWRESHGDDDHDSDDDDDDDDDDDGYEDSFQLPKSYNLEVAITLWLASCPMVAAKLQLLILFLTKLNSCDLPCCECCP